MDVTPFLELRPAPCAIFDRIEQDPARADAARFYVGAAGNAPAGSAWLAVTWGQFAQQIRSVALYLRHIGFAPGDRAAIFSGNRVSWASAALGIQAAGGVMVPVYPASTADQLAYVLAHSDARVLFVAEAALVERALAVRDRCPALAHVVILGAVGNEVETAAMPGTIGWSDAMSTGADLHARDPRAFGAMLDAVPVDAPGVMLYTSGTSGNPKGVPLTHANVGTNARDWLLCNGPLLDEGMVDLMWLPMSHIFGFGEMCLGNTLGFTTYMTAPHQVLTKLPEVRPSVFMSVPAYWEKLAQAALDAPAAERRERLHAVTGGRLQFCLSGGAGLKREVKELFHACGILIIEGYGLTETSPTLTLNRPDDFRFDTVGKPLPSVELRLAEDGEILARGPNVFTGYHKDPEATAACFTADGWFCTGDVGRFTEDGFLQIVDRKKDILVTAGGKNVPPANIELRFRDDPLIESLVVYGDGKRYLVAGVWVSRDAAARELGTAAPSAADLDALVRQRIERVNAELASYETIKRFCIMDTPLTVEAGLLTASLKLRRKQVYAAFRDRFESLYEPAAGATPGAMSGAPGAPGANPSAS
ncbi:MAG TPA: AMP-dependent synthetase/ligase [Haliangium sp.]|nr:AMP-dependent synthetase/ligase [Haliangium sp.]